MAKVISSEKMGYIEQLNNIPTEPTEDVLLTKANIITNFKDNWKALTNAEKLQFLQNYIEKISVVSRKDEGYKVEILGVDFYME